MSTYAEMNRQRKLARPIFLELRALGLDLRAGEDPQEPLGYYVEVRGLCSLSEAHAERVARRIEERKPGLVRILMMGEWDPDYLRNKGGGRSRVSERGEEVRRAWEEVEELEAARLRMSGDVMRGDPKALAADRRLERRLRDLTRWIMRAEQDEEDERRADTEHRGEQLRQAWREHHPSQEDREKGRPKKGRPT